MPHTLFFNRVKSILVDDRGPTGVWEGARYKSRPRVVTLPGLFEVSHSASNGLGCTERDELGESLFFLYSHKAIINSNKFYCSVSNADLQFTLEQYFLFYDAVEPGTNQSFIPSQVLGVFVF